MRRISVFMAVFLCLFTTPAQAQLEEYELDKAHTQILFFADHLGFSKSQGEFHDYDGKFFFDWAHPENSSVSVTIYTKSIDMDDDKWDTHMKSDDFFDVENYPTMTFESTEIKVTGDKKAAIKGNLTLLGKTKPVTLYTRFNKKGRHPFNENYVAGFSIHTTIKRSDFGMTYGLPLLGDEVDIRIEAEGIRKDKEGQEPYNQ